MTAAVLPLAVLLWNYSGQDRSRYTIARDYAQSILRTLPPGALYVPGGDHATFPVLYLQIVEGLRPDVLVADKYGYLDPQILRAVGATEDDIEYLRTVPRPQADRWLIDNSDRPVFVNAKRAIEEIPTERFLSVGLLYRIDRARQLLSPEEEARLWASYRFGNLDAGLRWVRGSIDMAARFILTDLLTHRAESFYQHGEREKAVETLSQLATVGAGYREVLQNAACILSEWGCPEEACTFYAQALAVDPDYALCRRNYARTLFTAGDTGDTVIRLAERSLAEMGADPLFLKQLGTVYRARQRYRNACEAFLGATQLDPSDHEAYRLAGEVYEENLKAPGTARELYAASLERKPTQPVLIEKVYGEAARRRYEAKAQRALDAMSAPHVPAALTPFMDGPGSFRGEDLGAGHVSATTVSSPQGGDDG